MSFVDIFVALKDVCKYSNIEATSDVEAVMNSLCLNKIELQDAINKLSEHLVNTTNAEVLKKYLSNLLLALVSAKIPLHPVISKNGGDMWDRRNHLDNSYVLSTLSDHPDILQYALKYFEINPLPPFAVSTAQSSNYKFHPKKRRHAFHLDLTDKQVVSCSYKLLTKLPNEFSVKWDWTIFIHRFSNNTDPEIRWMVKECMVIVTNMTEVQSSKLSKKLRVPEDAELKFISSVKESIVRPVDEPVKDENLCNVANIDGIMIPLYNKKNVQKSSLVPVKSTVSNLRSLALAVASGKAVTLLGPVGSGKTSLVEHLAAITGRKGIAFRKVQLGDQTDSRMLLGSHQCTDVPGEFVWRPGVLTEAVQNGHWLLLEDIDCAALDVASTLSSLLERNTLCVPGYRDTLPVAPGFQLFVTQRTLVTNFGFQKKMSSSSTLLQKHLTQINVEPLSRLELKHIIQSLYPALSTISSRMIEVFLMFSVGSHDTSLQSTKTDSQDQSSIVVLRGSRLISTRDLIKWCTRSAQDFDVSSPESAMKVLQDALDIFTCSVSSPEHRLELSKKIGTCLGIVETKSEFYCKHHKPNVSLNPQSLDVGRAKVPRVEKSLETIDLENKQVVFSFTRQSACLLEKIACCVTSNEPVLLVGETGTGKTSSVQYLARQTGHKLVVINMNQQSDSADLLGGYKPVDMKFVIRPIINEFDGLFRSFYNVEKNKKFLGHIETCFETENWNALLTLVKQSSKAATMRLTAEKKEDRLKAWVAFGHKLSKLELQVKAASKLTFAFLEGSLVKAMQEGHWVLLDEINLASAEILECLAGLLEDKTENVELIEKGDKAPIKRHPDFTLFACMNPATDVGKKDLPVGLRNRFTEFFIDELTERNDLMLLIGDYLYHMNLSGAMLEAIYSFYASIRKEAKLSLVDGAGNAPHYSLRTLCRALMAAAKAKCGTVGRSLYEAFCLSFLTQLDSGSHPKVEAMIAKAVLGKKSVKSILNQMIPEPQVPGQNYLLFEGHWIPQGKLELEIPEGYILTATVRKNLRDIARIISLGRLPVLLQGDTSVGKTSLITYIAKASGNYCVRINNHEHTDLQEYIGSYATDASGRLVFKEGVLVEAMRKGYWIILDELNLAPSDVLEALNRVLDDNRELFIPETQQVVKADPNFMLFATQNPPGLYGGRKMLSRAFRNRFVELHFDEIPKKELEIILHQRCHVPPTYSKRMIEVMAELQTRRRGSAAVQGKDGFITLRDLFRWGQRYKQASKEYFNINKSNFYDWDQHIADEGYLVLAGKVRQADERRIIEEVIEKHIKRKVNPDNLFCLHQNTSSVTRYVVDKLQNNTLEQFSHVVWTYNMRRLGLLIAKAFMFNEPVLLVGETGCGKTTICQVLAALSNRDLLTVNCHMHTESSDFLGGLRPVRQYKNDGRLFEWVDGPLIKAMESGQLFLADEISLADDSVLERMNSLLEPERQLVLSERGMEENSDIVIVASHERFHFVGTMNPGGDFGKKELSPALRNRFTEIWCDSVSSKEDMLQVLEKSVSKGISLGNQEDGSSGIGSAILEFTQMLKGWEMTSKFPFSIRDLLSWVQFINVTVSKGLLEPPEAYVHGACMAFLDCFGTALTGHAENETLNMLREKAIDFLLKQIQTVGNEFAESLRELLCGKKTEFNAESDESKFGIKPFYIERGSSVLDQAEKFTFTAPTTGSNTLRLLRGLQLNKAILLEGNPGVGKTSLVTALAKSAGHKVVRINLSDQTDITDLFGTDLPTEDGSFKFKEGAFLSALQNGHWILLDELNLAPQSVLEGLNACLDHRGEVFVPELGKTFKVKEQTKLFACQNPLKQGGARRGLPVSFLNRFTQVYIDTLTKEDLTYIVKAQYSSIPEDILNKIVTFNCEISREITELQSWGHRGGPWEMNLRDIQRWCEAIIEDQQDGKRASPGKFVEMLYINRMRTAEDKEKMTKKYDEMFSPEYPRSHKNPQFSIDQSVINIGDVSLPRNAEKCFKSRRAMQTSSILLRSQISTLKALAQSVKMNWLTILVGPTATGKSTLVQILADLTANDLHVVPVTSAMDISDLLGGFEQVDLNRYLESLFDKIETLTIQVIRNAWLKQDEKKVNNLLSRLYNYNELLTNEDQTINEMEKYKTKIEFLLKHCSHLFVYAKKSADTLKKVEKLTLDLKSLQHKATTASAVNAGGKFEWVDSLLVKTMIDGSWLLLDNVNLTSAAVLDRLNGLLEPNGVLSIPERGEMCEIKPHPNFRIFFTMDPKYGEISRAMRNRGVEIYLLGHDDFNVKITDTMPYMDLNALLLSCEIPMKYHKVFVNCHELMTSYIHGLERPTMFHLMQAAHLTHQQMIRAVPFDVAFLNSFSDVYIKPRNANDFATTPSEPLAKIKNNMLKAIEDKLKHIEVIDVISASSTLRVKQLCTNSKQEVANQIAYSVIQVDEGFESYKITLIQTLYNMFVAYQRCPKDILMSLRAVLDMNFKERSDFDLKRKIFSQTSNDLAYKHFEDESNLMANERFFMEQYTLSEPVIKMSNKSLLILYNKLMAAYYMNVICSEEGIKFVDYSRAVRLGNLSDDFSQYPLLRNCLNYIEFIEDCVDLVINSIVELLDDEMTLCVLKLLNWKNRFYDVAFSPMFIRNDDDRTRTLDINNLKSLYLHCKWLHKHLFEQLFKLLPEGSPVVNNYNARVDGLIGPNGQVSSTTSNISKRLRKLYGQPRLYSSQEQYETCLSRRNLYKSVSVDLSKTLESQTYVLSMNYSVLINKEMALDVPNDKVVDDISEHIDKYNQKPDRVEILNVMKMPVYSYLLHRVLYALKKELFEVATDISLENKEMKQRPGLSEVLTVVVYYGKIYKVFGPELLNLLDLMQKLLDGSQQVDKKCMTHFKMRFWNEFYLTMTSSAAIYPKGFFNMSSTITEDMELIIPKKTPRRSMVMPLMVYYVAEITLPPVIEDFGESWAYEKVPLKKYQDYSSQLEMIQNMLWKNMGTLDLTSASLLKTNALFELEKFNEFMYYVCCIVLNKTFSRTNFMCQHFERCIEELRLCFQDTPEFVDMIEKADSIKKDLYGLVINPNYRSKCMTIQLLTSQLAMVTGLIFVTMMAKMKPVDPIDKYKLKVKYIEEDLRTFEGFLCAYYMQGLVFGNISENKSVTYSDVTTEMLLQNKESLKKLHPYCAVLLEIRSEMIQEANKYVIGHSYRPERPTYDDFFTCYNHVKKTVLATSTTSRLANGLLETSDTLYHSVLTGKHGSAVKALSMKHIKIARMWLQSLNACYESIDNDFSEAFPEIGKPFKAAMSQVRHSVVVLCDWMVQTAEKAELGTSISDTVTKLIKYPDTMPNLDAKGNHLKRFMQPQMSLLLRRNAIVNGDSTETQFHEMQILKINLYELKMYATAMESVDGDILEIMLSTLDKLVSTWQTQQMNIEKKKEDDEALYVTKSKCEDEDDEAEAQREITEMFPVFLEQDFADFKPTNLERPKIAENKKKTELDISFEDVSFVYNWHANFVRNFTRAEWLPSPKKSVGNDVVSPLLQRYPVFGRIVNNSWETLDSSLEAVTSPSLMTIVALIRDKVKGTAQPNAKIDFYRSPWLSEATQCIPLLKNVREATEALLEAWPDFPTLKDIIVIIDRMEKFPLTSPLTRFLTGLELLRDKIEEWNKNAHSGNNMIEQSLMLGQQIVNWRKLEMSNWKECLNNLYQRKQAEAHKYWFYLYNVIESYLQESEEQIPARRVIGVLRDFIERSSLAEYQVRLDVVYAYHCHLVHVKRGDRRDELLSILWNTYNYYSQFSAQVAAHIKEKRAPIEKKLRDFVKICTWDRDLSYWSVKDTVDKAHKALHKHTKEFENVLKESAAGCLADTSAEPGAEHVGIWDRPKRASAAAPAGGAYMIDTQNFIMQPKTLKTYAEGPIVDIPEAPLLSKCITLLHKARALCKDVIAHTAYPGRVQALDDFVTVVIETSTHLGSLEVDATQPKDKQISQAKSIVQQKRKALADLFKYLTKMGLNYRTGLVILSTTEELHDFTIPPVDLDAAMAYLKTRRCDATLSMLWSGCETYFQKNIARHRLLTNALQSPHQDLGMPNIERCKGFSAHLVKITNIQKKTIAEYSTYLYELRSLASILMNATEPYTSEFDLSTIGQKVAILTQVYAQCCVTLDQYLVVLKSCPEKTDDEVEFDSVISDAPVILCHKNSEEWSALYKQIKNLKASVCKQIIALNNLQHIPKKIGRDLSVPVISKKHVDVLNGAKTNLEDMVKVITVLVDENRYKIKDPILFNTVSMQHPLMATMNEMVSYLRNTIAVIEKLDQPKDVDMDENLVDTLISKSEDVIATMLLIIQSIYKKHLPNKSDDSDILRAIDEIVETHSPQKQTEESKELLEDKHLKELLQEKLSSDLKMLQLDSLICKVQELLESYMQYLVKSKNTSLGTDAVTKAMAILHQLVLFVQYFLSQKVAVHRVTCKMLSVLLKIFSDLAAKGFCKPSDLDTEEGDGEGGPGKLSGGTGLGDGEGQKDVSDRIENQDQLDDAHRPGEEKNEEDRDCKEEEKGVNMTDDFDSHLQDVEKKEGDESDQDDDEDDADKQMGDTDNAAEKLDQQIWGDEEEEEEEKNGDKKDKEEKGQGESTGEKEMGAKEEEKGTDDGTEGKERKEKKDMNEKDPEVDDDHIDPYHGNQQQMPEPEEFEMPDNMDIDGEDDDKDGETETENPFEIDVTKDDMPKEQEDTEADDKGEEGKDSKHGMEVSSDEEGDGEEENKEQKEKEDEDKTEEAAPETETQADDKSGDIDENAEPDEPEKQPEEDAEPAEAEKEELPKNPDKIDEDDEVEQKNQEANPQANPSNDDPSAQDKTENAQMDRGTDDNVETNAEQMKDEESAPFEQAQEQVGEEKQSMGRSELDQSDRGHRGEKQAASRADRAQEKMKKHENKPGKTDQERTLGEVSEKKHKQMQTLNVERDEEMDEGGQGDDNEEKDADAYQHVKQAKKDDLQAVDAATKEQAEQQPTLQQDDEEGEKPKEDEEIAMDVDEDELQVEKAEELKPEKIKDGKQADKEKDKSGTKDDCDDNSGDIGIEVDGETVVTLHVPRGRDTTFHTRLEEQSQATRPEDMSMEQYMTIREWLRSDTPHAQATAGVWRSLWQESAPAARALCERLRLVLEPTGRSRMAGDYRTGRRINMRRVIPYIASHFRKDRIWLRRTAPARREYKIAIAVDDSSSMSDNRSKELAFESLALVSQALNLLESGDLAVLSFGEKPNLLHPFTEQFSEHSGSKILEQLRFDQTKTKIGQLLDFVTVMFEEQVVTSDAVNAKLLVIVSDGRGIFTEGETRVIQAVRRAKQQGIFLVYVIIDNPDNKDSIMDIRRPIIDPENATSIRFASYLDTFPFPFYLILRDMSALPMVLGDALRQWFELAANVAN